jgi:hypothetical protein
MGAPQTLALALALFGGAAIGAAVGGALFLGRGRAGATATVAACAGGGALFGLIATVGLPMPALASLLPRLEQASAGAELERVLKTYYPQAYAEAKSTAGTLKAGGASDQQITDAMRRVALPLLRDQMPLASKENALAYLGIAKDEQAFLSSTPELCYRVLVTPSAGALDELEQALPADLKAREAQAAVKLLEQTATAPQPAKMTDDLKSKLEIWTRDAFWGLSFEERDALKGGGPLQAKAGCDFVGNFLRPLDMMGGDDAAEAFKSLSSQGLQQFNG